VLGVALFLPADKPSPPGSKSVRGPCCRAASALVSPSTDLRARGCSGLLCCVRNFWLLLTRSAPPGASDPALRQSLWPAAARARVPRFVLCGSGLRSQHVDEVEAEAEQRPQTPVPMPHSRTSRAPPAEQATAHQRQEARCLQLKCVHALDMDGNASICGADADAKAIYA